MAVFTIKYPQGAEFGNIIINQVVERAFVNGERGIDLLLGVLTVAG